ncbi:MULTISPECIES: hypothetical protein [Mycetohabitans]|uniref:hypothetical protein n=1 Tax=Mycetohabitans TaxID=2571159 RepID=UPI001F236948|nr:hypothetical protein [Mycetohabitans sp. B3]MCF2134585.1 hypothetical protein [Mycetohabitans sp. B3]
MSDIIVMDGDTLLFEPMFGNRQVIVAAPVMIRGSGHATVSGRPVCVLGDEKKVQAQAQYLIPGYSPGQGLVSILQLLPNQQTPRCNSGAPILLKGQQFIARFTPTQPAIMTNPPNSPDVPTPTMGKGRFMTTQMFARAG